jgi:hypothetical protein
LPTLLRLLLTAFVIPRSPGSSIEILRRSPQIYSRSVAGFPFDVIYLHVDGTIYVVAYAHEGRRPEYWTRRLGPDVDPRACR